MLELHYYTRIVRTVTVAASSVKPTPIFLKLKNKPYAPTA
jgi:hypothetical protein